MRHHAIRRALPHLTRAKAARNQLRRHAYECNTVTIFTINNIIIASSPRQHPSLHRHRAVIGGVVPCVGACRCGRGDVDGGIISSTDIHADVDRRCSRAATAAALRRRARRARGRCRRKRLVGHPSGARAHSRNECCRLLMLTKLPIV